MELYTEISNVIKNQSKFMAFAERIKKKKKEHSFDVFYFIPGMPDLHSVGEAGFS